MRIIIFILILVNTVFAQNQVFNSTKYLTIKHQEWFDIHQLYREGDINLALDTPKSKTNAIIFKTGWVSYYDFSKGKFLRKKDNSSKRVVSLKRTHFFNGDQIYDSEYSKFSIKIFEAEDDVQIFLCDDVSGGTEESGKGCKIVKTEHYLFIQYSQKTYIFSK